MRSDALVGMTSDRFTLFGVRLDMSQEEAWQVLQNDKSVVGEQDPQNPFISEGAIKVAGTVMAT